ncbi:MAG TPA: 23S rRNA (pseudouridine(1915)-N(3))-methyltransferase RlmH [Casimicrobiaceae bacterium]|nr:23S rRNA (pseudouridine(1915)-N(3))-methyltransferase RlmH [Casimicrobiaceae bacterium]
MKLRIVALGHRTPRWVSEGYDEFAKRLPREYALELVELKPEARERGRSVAQMLATEAKRVEAACAGYRIVALDEHGAAWTTHDLAERLRGWRDGNEAIAFVVGSADGLDVTLKSQAAAVVALSAMTLPHGLARILLAEQIYRATTLLLGHPYHRG